MLHCRPSSLLVLTIPKISNPFCKLVTPESLLLLWIVFKSMYFPLFGKSLKLLFRGQLCASCIHSMVRYSFLLFVVRFLALSFEGTTCPVGTDDNLLDLQAWLPELV